MALGRCFSSGTVCLLLHVETARGSLSCPCPKTSLSSICSGPSPVKWADCLVLSHRNLKLRDSLQRLVMGISCTPSFFLYSSSGPLLPLPHPGLKFLSLLNYFKKCTTCPLRHRKLHLMVYCIRISIFRQKSTDTISDFLSPYSSYLPLLAPLGLAAAMV